MSGLTYSKVVLRPAMETIHWFYPESILDLYVSGVIVRSFQGCENQFKVGDSIQVYEQGRGGQDMPRTKGDLMFSIPFSNIVEFERVYATGEQLDFFNRLIDLNKRYLQNRDYGEEKYNKEKLQLKLEADEKGINVVWSKFEMPHEWAKSVKNETS